MVYTESSCDFVEQFAFTQVSYVLVRFLQRYERMESLGPRGDIKKDTGLIMSPVHGVKVRLCRSQRQIGSSRQKVRSMTVGEQLEYPFGRGI